MKEKELQGKLFPPCITRYMMNSKGYNQPLEDFHLKLLLLMPLWLLQWLSQLSHNLIRAQ